MANIPGSTIIQNDHTVTAQWLLGNADTGLATRIARWPNQSVAVTGTFGGATVVIQGSNDNVNFVTLNDKTATPVALSFAAAGFKDIRELPTYIRASTSGGAGTAVVVTINGSGGQE